VGGQRNCGVDSPTLARMYVFFFFNRLAIHDLCDLCNLVLFCAFEIPSARFFDLVWPKMKRDRFASAQTNAIGEMG
jgi:hypothetical protein